MVRSLLLCLIISIGWKTNAQDSLSYQSKGNNGIKWTRAVAAPIILVTAGLVAMTDNEVVDNEETSELRNRLAPRFHTHFDDYLQYSPILVVYGLNALGIKGQNDFINRTLLLVKSELIMAAIVTPLKKFTAVPRPDTGSPTSFPSGHTAQAFAAATFLHKEYGKDYPIVSVLAYGTAASIGILRVLNNRHHMSDVLAGAGIGILSTNIAYLTHQYRWGHRSSSPTLELTPVYSRGAIGAGMVMNLK